jgi:murein DD-endopeptidase MepM/ murein hydrolase activator NlpD
MRKLVYFFLAVSLPAISFANGPGKDAARDTASAVVVYDADAKFIPNTSISVEDYTALIDSLVLLDTIPVALVNQLNVYRTLSLRNPGELSQVIDSIFESPHVPKSVLNAVNIYMTAMRESMDVPTGFAAYIPQDASPYPANVFYGDWNTDVPNPSRNSLAAFDTTLTLLLVDSAQNCGFHTPFAGVVTSNFGWRYGRNHNGIDIDLEVWDPVRAAFPGVVRVAKYYQGFGRVVVIRHHNGLETTYAHLHRFKVKPGDEVDAGDIVGLGGSSGNSTGSHLHFEVRFQGVPIKPSQIIDFRNHTLRSEVLHLQRAGAFIAAVPKGARIYEVKKGDYLYKIAQEYGVTVGKLRELNHIANNETLRVGQKIRIGT